MSLDAEIFAIGGYSPRVRPFLEFPERYYDGTRDDAAVFRFMFGIHFTRGVVELEACVGPLGRRFDASKADLPRLAKFADTYPCRGPDLEAFQALRDARFSFYLTSNVPNVSEWASGASSSSSDRMPLGACVLAVAPPEAQAHDQAVEGFLFDAACDPHVADAFSRDLAQALHLDPWDFNQHVITHLPTADELERLHANLKEDEVLAWDMARQAAEFIEWTQHKQASGWTLLYVPSRWRSR